MKDTAKEKKDLGYKYPEYIMKKLRSMNELEEDDTSCDEELQKLDPMEVFSQVLTYDGILSYDSTILRWISDIFGVALDPFSKRYEADEDFKPRLVFGFGNIIRAFPIGYTQDVEKMEYDPETELVTIYYNGGGKDYANICADSAVAAMYDIIKQALL